MSVTKSITPDSKRVDINISGRFDFSVHKEFRDAYRNHPGLAEYRVNLNAASYMDSSALGMLLLLREHSGEDRNRVVLCNPSPGIRKILEIANFDRLFRIE